MLYLAFITSSLFVCSALMQIQQSQKGRFSKRKQKHHTVSQSQCAFWELAPLQQFGKWLADSGCMSSKQCIRVKMCHSMQRFLLVGDTANQYWGCKFMQQNEEWIHLYQLRLLRKCFLTAFCQKQTIKHMTKTFQTGCVMLPRKTCNLAICIYESVKAAIVLLCPFYLGIYFYNFN